MDLKEHIRGIPDFPKPGVLFYDISTLLRDADAWQVAMGRMAKAVRAYQPDLLAGIESRGFLIAAPLALKLGCGFIMLRKRNKLPGVTVGLNYSLEYGTDRVEIQADAVEPGQRVVVVDDLLATGGTMSAGIALLRQVGAKSEFRFGISMEFADQRAYDGYNEHPAHVRFVSERWVPEVSDFLELDSAPLGP